jgi:hypothetical protein
MPFVVIDKVRITDLKTATEGLRSHVVPAVKQAPGFVRGAWATNQNGDGGLGFVIYETREQAEQAKQFMESNVTLPNGVTFDSIEIYEVQAEA